jgi:hypothetical protein
MPKRRVWCSKRSSFTTSASSLLNKRQGYRKTPLSLLKLIRSAPLRSLRLNTATASRSRQASL